MSNTVKIKRGSGAPGTGDIAVYELAYDYTNNKLYIHDPTESSGQEIVEITGTDTNTTYTAGTNLTLDGTEFDVDDAFLINSGNDTTSGTITAAGFTTTGNLSLAGHAVNDIDIGSEFVDADDHLMTSGAIKEKIESYSYLTSVPNHSAALLTSGTLPLARLANIADSHIASDASISASKIADLAASKITSGTFDAARIPTIDISSKTNLSAGTNISLSGDTLNVDDAFLINSGNDTTSGTITAAGFTTSGDVTTDTHLLVNSSGVTVRRYVSAWSNAQTHDVVYNGYGSDIGDYVYLKASGNGTAGHGMAIVGDNLFAVGDSNVETGAITNSLTAPMTDTWFYVNGSGNGWFKNDVTIAGELTVSGTNAFTIGNVAGAARIQESSGTFTLLTTGNAYASLEVDDLTANGSVSIGGHAMADIDVGSEFVDTDDHLMTSGAIKEKIESYGYATSGSIASLSATDDRDFKPNTIDTSGQVRAYFTTLEGMTGSAGSDYQDMLVLDTYSDGTGGDSNALVFDKSTHNIYHYLADQAASTWGTPKRLAYIENGSNNRVMTASSSSTVNGEANLTFNGSTLTFDGSDNGNRNIELGSGGTGTAFIDLIGDDTYTDYGARFIRWGSGANSTTDLVHRGTGDFRFITSDAANILWLTGGAEKMRMVHSTGNLGIGTNSPTQKLDVAGHAHIEGNIYFGDDSVWQLDDTSWTGGSANQANIMLTGASGWFGFHGDSSNTVSILADGDIRALGHMRVGNNEGYTQYDAAGNIATVMNQDGSDILLIGDTTHTEQIKIQTAHSTGNGGLFLSNDGNVSISGNLSLSSPMSCNYGLTINEGGHSSDTRIEGDSNANLVRVDASEDRVGIGTGSPSARFHVYSDAESVMWFQNGSTSNVQSIEMDSSRFYFYNRTASAFNSISVLNDGKVGIGQITPGYKLDVSGDARFTNDLRSEGRLMGQNGSAAAPAYSFTSQGNAGMYRYGTGIGFTAAGTERVRIESDKLYITGAGVNTFRIQFPNDQRIYDNGSGGLRVGAASHELELYSGGSDPITFITGGISGTERMRITPGKIGIMTTTPYEALEVESQSSTSPAIVAANQASNGCFNMAHGYGGANGDYVNTYSTQYSSIATVIGYGVKASTDTNDQFLCSADNSNFTRGALVIDDELRFWQAGAQNGTLNNAITMTERFRLTAAGIGHFDSDVVAYSSTVSDKRLKENITTIDNALDKVMALRGVEYDWTATSRKGTHDIGLVAQEVEEVIPELVTEHELCTGEFGGEGNEKTFKTVNYDKIVGVLIEAIKEQQVQIDELKTKLGDSNG